MGKFIISTDKEITEKNIDLWLKSFERDILPQLNELQDLYKGRESLGKPQYDKSKFDVNNTVHVPLSKLIVTNSVNYFIGKPAQYKFNDFDPKKIEDLQENEEQENKSLAKDCSKYGLAYELVNVKSKRGKKNLYYKRLDPRNSFCVVDSSILEETICYVTYTIVKLENQSPYKQGFVYTDEFIQEFNTKNGTVSFGKKEVNVFDDFPVILYKNNDELQGDFESVKEPLKAYNKTYSCTLDDLESIANALLIFYNIILTDEDRAKLNKSRVLGVASDDGQQDAKAEYITKKLDITSFDTFRKDLREDIFAITNCPDFTDENFGGNQSGEAISYKLLGPENLRRDKVIYFRQGLLNRWKLIASYKGSEFEIKKGNIEIEFFANIPENLAQDLQYIKMWLDGAISLETMLSKLETVKNPEEEKKRILDEQNEEMKRTKEIIGNEEVPMAKTARLRV